jgi:hypothetical protein
MGYRSKIMNNDNSIRFTNKTVSMGTVGTVVGAIAGAGCEYFGQKIVLENPEIKQTIKTKLDASKICSQDFIPKFKTHKAKGKVIESIFLKIDSVIKNKSIDYKKVLKAGGLGALMLGLVGLATGYLTDVRNKVQ